MTLETGDAILMRHVDKGSWKYNEEQIKQALAPNEANLVINILKENGFHNETLPLALDGLKRAIRAGDEVFKELPERSILVTIDSKKPRADLSEALINARIAQLESQNEKTDHSKRVDMVHMEEKELSALLQDENTNTWETFAKMMEEEGINENAAIARQINTVDQPSFSTPEGSEIASQAAARYKNLLTELRKRISSEDIPVIIMGVGHSGPLSIIKHQEKGEDLGEEDVPTFAQMFIFNGTNNLAKEKKIAF